MLSTNNLHGTASWPGGRMDARYDVFVSLTRAAADLAVARPLAQALRGQGLRVFLEEQELHDFDRITSSCAGFEAPALAGASGTEARLQLSFTISGENV
jgi:hypothetical protein